MCIIIYHINSEDSTFFKSFFYNVYIFRLNNNYPIPGISNFFSNVLSILVTIDIIKGVLFHETS